MNIQHGGDIYSQEILWDFSVNLNPLGPPEGVKEAVRRSADGFALYPDSQCRRLRAALAKYHQVEEEMLCCANGAADLIYQLAFALRPKYALLPVPTFSEYGQALSAVGCQSFSVVFGEEKGFVIDIETLLREAEKRKRQGTPPDIIFLCNPNNPTGLVVSGGEMEELAAYAQREGIRLVVDECFMDFLEEEKDSLLLCLHKYPSLVILKAFTKLYSMAGLRLGYGLSSDRLLLQKISAVRQPWSVSVPAQMAGMAALKERDYRLRTKKAVAEGRNQLFEGLCRLGFQVYPSQANFLFFKDRQAGAESGLLYDYCRDRKLLLRSCADVEGLDGSYYRVAVKTREENEHLLAVLHGKNADSLKNTKIPDS